MVLDLVKAVIVIGLLDYILSRVQTMAAGAVTNQ